MSKSKNIVRNVLRIQTTNHLQASKLLVRFALTGFGKQIPHALLQLFKAFSLKSYRNIQSPPAKSTPLMSIFGMDFIPCNDYERPDRKNLVFVADAPVTQEQYLRLSKGLAKPTKKDFSSSFEEFPGKDKPAYNLAYINVLKFCNKLNKMLGFDECYKIFEFKATKEEIEEYYRPVFVLLDTKAQGFRLPTLEAWLYCANGNENPGKDTFYSGTTDPSKVFRYGWLALNSEEKLQNVKKKIPNKAGFFDMTGNVYEYVEKVLVIEGRYVDPELPDDVLDFLKENPKYMFFCRESTEARSIRPIAIGGDFLCLTSEVQLSKAEETLNSYLDYYQQNSNRLFTYSMGSFDPDSYPDFLGSFELTEKEEIQFEFSLSPKMERSANGAEVVYTGFRLALVLKG